MTEFADIRPYNDEETVAALRKLVEHPYAAMASKVLFPEQDDDFLKNAVGMMKGVDDFQKLVVRRCVEWVVKNTMSEFTYDGIENMQKVKGRYLGVSNHRDIIVDPAVTQYVLFLSGLETSQLCVGDNLLKNPLVEALIRSNKMIKVVRGLNPRALYESSMKLSKYIRLSISSGNSSVWIAQREGRAKNGVDVTEQGILKMFDMSGSGDFATDFKELNIVPMSISYEYEPCDILKARELLISRTQKYVKGENEDVQSIITGIKQFKGHVHLSIAEPLSSEEIDAASLCQKNERYQYLKQVIDRRIIMGYKLWKTNYMADSIVNDNEKYASKYTPEEMEAFKAYIEKQLDTVEPELSRADLKDILLHIYSNPVQSKEDITL